MQDNHKTTLWTVLGAAVVIIIALLAWRAAHKKPAETATTTPPAATDQTAAPAANQATTTPTVPKTPTSAATSNLAYTKAVNTYQYRIQFSQCHGIIGNNTNVGSLSIKKGDKLMLDNRDATAHTIAFKGQSVRLAGYGYAIVSPTVTGQYPVTCDGGGAATLNVQ